MPSLPEEMYCSEQICIPPSFPYLLRQYAKAAIRTQPVDILKWSTAYFRCLSLNIPPPVKPRLEYPIPRDFRGITPGWLKALLYQLQNNITIPFKILWDRWIGACLDHHTLIQLLCLGGFDNPQEIPWLRFVAICAGTLTDDLTHTMILICEILTEEPEGGSAMINLETFTDLYVYLAKIDASNGQTLRNYYFRDSLLSLWRDKVQKEEAPEIEKVESAVVVQDSISSKTSTESAEEENLDDVAKVISCPSLPEDDYLSIEYVLKEEDEDEEEGDEGQTGDQDLPSNADKAETELPVLGEQDNEEGNEEEATEKPEEEEKPKEELEQKEEGEEVNEDEKEGGDQESEKEEADENIEKEDGQQDNTEEHNEAETTQETDESKTDKPNEAGEEKITEDGDDEVKEYESVDTISELPVRDLDNIFEDTDTLREDLERLRALQQELAGETDEDIERFKCRLIEEMPLTQSQEEGVKHFKHEQMDPSSSEEKIKVISQEQKSGDVRSESHESAEDKREYDNIYVEAIPGIGSVVPDDLITAVVDYMKSCAKGQHGMVMPRNIRHYSCPPLEIFEY